jgi:DNA-binding GntR family transcriptional regulator
VTPIYQVSARRFARWLAPADFWQLVIAQHKAIVDAIAAGDGPGAARAMTEHLRALAPAYRALDEMYSAPALARDSRQGPLAQ